MNTTRRFCPFNMDDIVFNNDYKVEYLFVKSRYYMPEKTNTTHKDHLTNLVVEGMSKRLPEYKNINEYKSNDVFFSEIEAHHHVFGRKSIEYQLDMIIYVLINHEDKVFYFSSPKHEHKRVHDDYDKFEAGEKF